MKFDNVSDSDLLARYKRLEANTSAMTMDDELARCYALQCMSEEIMRRELTEEQQIYPPTVWSYNWLDPYDAEKHGKVCREISNDCYHNAMKHRKVGDVLVHWAGAPGTGQVSYRITRMDATGVYGKIISNTVRELTEAEVR